MKKIPCSYKHCDQRRIHFTIQDENRPRQMVEVDDDHEGDAYCSLTCAILDGKMTVKNKHRKGGCVIFLESGLPCEDCDLEGHAVMCGWHKDWHKCNCGAFDKEETND